MKKLLSLATAVLLSAAAPAVPPDQDPLFCEVQQSTFQYFWQGAEPNSGLARERIHCDGIYPDHDQDVVTIGGSGFGVMALLVGAERGFITRVECVARLDKIVGFLEKADRFHGAWPHWLYGPTGKVKPFGTKDNGGDLVETSFMAQGLLCARQWLRLSNDAAEEKLAERVDRLWRDIDFDWFRNGQNVLYWHWSPDYAWQMNFPVHGYNECLIMYVLAASSPTHPIANARDVYDQGWAENGKIREPREAMGVPLQAHYQGTQPNGGPLFWAHYSYLGLKPAGLKDRWIDYGRETSSQALADYRWCVANPKRFDGYGADSWGLTSSYSVKGYAGHAPDPEHDLGVIAPTAALSSFPYLPEEASAAMHHWKEKFGDKLFGPYGPYDAFSETEGWMPPRYLAIDQGPIVVMMENYRSGLLWKLFMSCPEVKTGLSKLGMTSQASSK